MTKRTVNRSPAVVRTVPQQPPPPSPQQLPEATKEIFRKLLRHKVDFTEAGSIDGDQIFMSGTIAGRPFSLSLSVDKPYELLK